MMDESREAGFLYIWTEVLLDLNAMSRRLSAFHYREGGHFQCVHKQWIVYIFENRLKFCLCCKKPEEIHQILVPFSIFVIITYDSHLQGCDNTPWARILPQQLFLILLLENEHSSLYFQETEKNFERETPFISISITLFSISE